MELKSVANDFFDKFANSIEQDDGPKWFRIVVGRFIGFGNNDRSWFFEVRRPIA